jgi:L-alanine-DL-glutamate epimerase-like enolase superfamily enzyme
MPASHQATITEIRCRAYTIPTDLPEADGTFAWNSTTLIVVEVDACDATGLGYTYSDAAAAKLVRDTIAPDIVQDDCWNIEMLWQKMQRRLRNDGRSGLVATAISAVDCALWDLKSKLLDLPLVILLGASRLSVPIYGSGGFTTYTETQTKEQLTRWVEHDGCRWVKIKIGSNPEEDPARVKSARDAIDASTGLFVDANGAYVEKTALAYSHTFAEQGVAWFEEPVSSDDLAGLCSLRERVPAPMEIAAGEYGYTLDYFRRMLTAHSVDVLQADVSRCGGVTGFMRVAALCGAFHIPLSAHCAPALHLHVASAVARLRHQEWFHDHVRIESMLFDGAPKPVKGEISPDLTRPGCGLEFKHADAQRYFIG